MQNIESHVLPPLLNLRTIFFFFFFFCFFKNLLQLKINILSSVYPEIIFSAEQVMKIINLSRPKVPPPPPLRIKWSSSKTGLNNWSISKSPKRGTEPGVRKGKRSLLAINTRCKCSIETTRNSVKLTYMLTIQS